MALAQQAATAAELLRALQNADSAIRKAAEQKLEEALKSTPNELVRSLVALSPAMPVWATAAAAAAQWRTMGPIERRCSQGVLWAN
ncbi:unnamed protein product [Polarella glacialis]|uniref:Uncharacterized protein n=1 Tax=Polarella glacialis TaxID=89957 RepID=A0A813JMB1_POLGL|nr:unnamed protein product [Polarella glacialis]